MTIVVVMECLAELLRKAVKDYSTNQPSGKLPVNVYIGYPPIPNTPNEKNSFIYCKVTSFKDEPANQLGTVQVDIGFSIYDDDKIEGSLSLFNLMEHVRQCLLANPYIKDTDGKAKNHMEFPLTGEIFDDQPFPQWQGMIHVTYTIAQPMNVEDIF